VKVSFVIPAYNEEKMVGKCLASVFKEIQRQNSDIRCPSFEVEVVVVDNASTDRTREKALKFAGVTVVRENLKGLVYARRAGWVATSGDIVANIDADTMVPKGWLSTVMSEFAKDKNLVALSGPYLYYDISVFENLLVKVFYFFGWLIYLFTHFVLNKGAMLQGGNFILRRDAWDRAGGFDTSIAFYGEDTDVARRISKQGKVLWTWRLPMYTSGRRLRREGIVRVGFTYALNFFSTSITGRPATKHYSDVRIDA